MREIKKNERPIIFNGEMVRAILDGRKTQTRRIMKPQPKPTPDDYYGKKGHRWPSKKHQSMLHVEGELQNGYGNWNGLASDACPFGAVGDRLWVRETWMPDAPRDGTWGDVEFYGCNGSPLSMIPKRFRKPEHCIHRASWDGSEMVGWTPSIHMPRWASRIILEITDVRVERLQDISEQDAIAEGCVSSIHMQGGRFADENFAWLWQSIYGDESWSSNPWVWVIEFKVLATNGAHQCQP